MNPFNTDKPLDKKSIADLFESVRISLASPEKILDWSFGEITKPETRSGSNAGIGPA
jgi:DNA-directed RNA polymerase subunit beta'